MSGHEEAQFLEDIRRLVRRNREVYKTVRSRRRRWGEEDMSSSEEEVDAGAVEAEEEAEVEEAGVEPERREEGSMARFFTPARAVPLG